MYDPPPAYKFPRDPANPHSSGTSSDALSRAPSLSSIPSLVRSFHQSQSWLVEEQKKESSAAQDAVSESSGTTSEPVGQSEHQSQTVSEQTPDSAEPPQSNVSSAQDAVSESSGTTSEPVGQSETSQSVSEQASDIAQKAQSTVSEAASIVAEKAQEIPSQAQESFSNASREARSAARSAKEHAGNFNPFSAAPVPKSKVLYIGNLFFEVTAPQLEAEFGKYGEVSNSRVITDNRGLSKGFGYLEFATQEEADAALDNLNQKVFQGRRLSVQYHKRRDANNRQRKTQRDAAPPSKTLFIGNMSYQMSDRDLNDLFRQIRNVLDVRVAIDRRSGQPRGFAHADFMDIDSAVKAKEVLEQKIVYGRNLRVDFSGSSPPQGQNRRSRDDSETPQE
ncbi:hypothetical protein Q7P37_009422 [Cladosporium fusiforme]